MFRVCVSAVALHTCTGRHLRLREIWQLIAKEVSVQKGQLRAVSKREREREREREFTVR